MREHRPEALQGLGGHARRELRHVAFEVGADEVLAQHEALVVGAGEEAVREATAQPELLALGLRLPCFEHVEGAHVDVGDAAGQALARLPEQIDRRGARHQEPAVPVPAPAALVDQAAQRLEELQHAEESSMHD